MGNYRYSQYTPYNYHPCMEHTLQKVTRWLSKTSLISSLNEMKLCCKYFPHVRKISTSKTNISLEKSKNIKMQDGCKNEETFFFQLQIQLNA